MRARGRASAPSSNRWLRYARRVTRGRAISLVAAVLLVGCVGGGERVAPRAPVVEPEPPPVDPFADAVAELARPLIEGEWLTGLSIGLVAGDDVYFYGFGHVATNRPRAPDADTIFEIGSVTKAFTALVLADAVGRMRVELDDPVSRWLGEGRAVPTFDGREITLAQLASHTSGLPRMPANFAPADPDNPFADYGEDALYEFLASYELPRAPGQRYEYSNLATGLLGHALARREQTSFEQLVTEHTDLVTSTRSFGVPAIVLADGNAIFGPVISNVPATTDEAVELWRHVLWLTEYENFSELKRDRTVEPDLEYSRRRRAAKMAEKGQAPLRDSSDQAV